MKLYIKAIGGRIMNTKRNDFILIFGLLAFRLLFLLFSIIFSSKDDLVANVYYDDEIILTVSLDKDNSYKVNGSLSEMIIIVQDKKIKVLESDCKDHICVNQGFIFRENQTITCLPNKIFIKLEKKDSLIDVVL